MRDRNLPAGLVVCPDIECGYEFLIDDSMHMLDSVTCPSCRIDYDRLKYELLDDEE